MKAPNPDTLKSVKDIARQTIAFAVVRPPAPERRWFRPPTVPAFFGGSDFKVYEGDPATTNDDIVAGPYTLQPENADVGVFCEEFGHNVFGLPDLYTLDFENSIGFWGIMAAGAWGGVIFTSVICSSRSSSGISSIGSRRRFSAA